VWNIKRKFSIDKELKDLDLKKIQFSFFANRFFPYTANREIIELEKKTVVKKFYVFPFANCLIMKELAIFFFSRCIPLAWTTFKMAAPSTTPTTLTTSTTFTVYTCV
jgi:hypothetical protein